MIAYLRLGLAIALFVLNMLVAGPGLYMIIYMDCIMGVGALRHRRNVQDWYLFWSFFIFSWAQHVLGITLDIQLPDDFELEILPYLWFCNHQSSLDILVLNWLAWTFGRPGFRWVSKEENRKYPFLGRSLEESGACFIDRNGGVSEFRKLGRFGTAMRQEGADIILFPEGTRFITRMIDGLFKWLLDPHVFAFSACHRGFEDRPVVRVLIHWKTKATHRTMFGVGIVGAKLTIRIRIIPPFSRKDAAEVMIKEYEFMDAELEELNKAA
jgi:1-acyl-sn-glycerol-3-phosphate acyltransferase